MKRREMMWRTGQGAIALGIAKTLHNTVVGYGQFGIGSNLISQDLEAIASAKFPSFRRRRYSQIDNNAVRVRSGIAEYEDDGEWREARDADHAAIRSFDRDVRTVTTGDFSFRFCDLQSFFEDIDPDSVRPAIVELLRGRAGADPETIMSLTSASLHDAEALVYGLADIFREQTRYDIPRYLAGAVDDNLLPVDANLREPFRPTVDFETLASQSTPIGLFCTEYTRLANAAVHSIPAVEQSPPIFGLTVRNARHKHVYNGFGTVVSHQDEMVLPITFADYTDSTLVDDFRLRKFVGERVNAFDTSHRADEIWWV